MWKEIKIPSECVLHKTDRAVLIRMPFGCEYEEYKFWHPSKITRFSGLDYEILYKEDFIFRLFKNGKGKYKKDIIDRLELKPVEIKEVFKNASFSWNEKETHVPEELEPEHVEVLKELLDE